MKSAAPYDYDTATATDVNTMAMTYEEAMDDVHTRFILNLPDDELRSAPRIFFQLEQAWWFYDDFICDGAAAAAAASSSNASNNASNATTTVTNATEELPRYKHVKPFSYAMFQFSPLLQPMLPHFDTMYDEFTNYKRSISTYGTILLNEAATQVALVRPWKSKSWTFPGGKVNQNESGYDAACRETYEETGFDPLVEPSVQPPSRTNNNSASPTTQRENSKLSYSERETNKQRTCFICRGVPTNFPFEPVARKEVSEVKWFDIASLPKQKTYAVLPFYNQLREWIKKDNEARGINVRDEDRGGRRRRTEESYFHDNDDDEGEDDGGLARFFSDDGKAPWEQDKEKEGGVDAECGADAVMGVESSSSGNTKGRNNNKHEKQPRRDSCGSSSKGKPKSQQRQQQQKGRRSTPPRASSTTSSRGGSTGRPRGGSTGRRRGTSGEEALLSESDPLVKSALATPGESGRWTEDEMFAANEKLLGRKITYDGNPHEFAAGGWGSGIIRDGTDKEMVDDRGRTSVDPHAFHVVGGSFMNSEAPASAAGGAALSSLLAPPPDASKLQPLVNARAMAPRSMLGAGGSGGGDDGLELTPFFSDNGRAPWEDINDTLGGGTNSLATKDSSPPYFPVQGAPLGRKNSKGLALLNMLRQGGIANEGGGDEEEGEGVVQSHVAMMAEVKDDADIDEWFMTDREITAKSQTKKLSMMSQSSEQAASVPHVGQYDVVTEDGSPPNDPNEHLAWMKNWVQQLPQAGPTNVFGDFRLDVDSIMNVMTATVAHTT